ncbi:MAG: tetratricopeptide repeat protein [Planctomycetia bacterium]|nr:tetratricopeptide repeat protein [Planctomycetia bacterium]
MGTHKNKITRQPDFQERRENAMRPSRYLGFDHDDLGVYFMEKAAFTFAESELRRAVWLNPFNVDFQAHLAVCLFKQKRYREAMAVARQVFQCAPDRPDMQNLMRLIDERSDFSAADAKPTHRS